MTITRWLRVIPGVFILLSLALGVDGSPLFLSRWWLAFTAFVGLNLLQFGFTNWCLMDSLLCRLGVPEDHGGACCGGGCGAP